MSPDAASRLAAQLVGAVFDLPPAEILADRKGSPVHVQARKVVCYLLNTDAEMDCAEIGRTIGRHRSTVLHAVASVTALREHPDFDAALDVLGGMFRDIASARARLPSLVEELSP